jgi:hypothetical protein
VRDNAFLIAGQVMQELRKLMPLGANIDELAAHMTLDKPELAATLAHLEAYDIVEIASTGFGGALHVEVERVHVRKLGTSDTTDLLSRARRCVASTPARPCERASPHVHTDLGGQDFGQAHQDLILVTVAAVFSAAVSTVSQTSGVAHPWRVIDTCIDGGWQRAVPPRIGPVEFGTLGSWSHCAAHASSTA